MTKTKPMNLAVVDQAVRSAFHADLARYLKKRCGARFHLYSPNAESLQRQKQDLSDVYDSFNVVDVGERVAQHPGDEAEIIRRATYYEERYGVPFGWFRIIDRAVGLGFSPGGYYHPRSVSTDKAPDLGIVANNIRQLDFWEREIQEKEIDVIINGFYFEYFPAKANGCKLRTALSSRNENYYFWADNCFGELAELEKTYTNITQPVAEISLDDAPVLNRKQLDKIVDRSKAYVQFARMVRIAVRHSYRLFKSDKSKQYRFTSDIASLWREWRVLRRLYGMGLPKAADIAGKDYVYYALQVEPESNFQGYSPEYFYQLSAIISLARDLPAGVALVVKEHLPAAGRRPDLFHKQIQLLKNVVFVDVRESGLELARNARAVATINGTVGQEAAVMGKPVITFGRRNLYNFLPHVRMIQKEEDLYPALRWALSPEFDAGQAKRDGLRYLAALRQHSFPMEDFGFHNPHGYTRITVEQAAEQFLCSIGVSAADGAVPPKWQAGLDVTERSIA